MKDYVIEGGFDMHDTVMKHKRDYLYVAVDGSGPGTFYGRVVSSRVAGYSVSKDTQHFNSDDFVVADCYVPPYQTAPEMFAALAQLADALEVPLFPVDTHFKRLIAYAKAARDLHRRIRDDVDDMPYRS